MPYSPILATLGYVVSPDSQRVLLIHRNGKPGDHHFGKFNGLGGKMEPGVKATLMELYRERTNGDAAAASKWIDDLGTHNRYVLDVWAGG